MNTGTQMLIGAMLIALIGWLASVHWMRGTTRFSERTRRRLVVPLWIPWMALALASVVIPGRISLGEALQGTTGFSVGLLVFMVSVRGRQTS